MAFAAPKLKSRLVGYSLDLQAKRLLAGRAQPEIARSLSAACRRGQQMDSSASTGDTLESCSTVGGSQWTRQHPFPHRTADLRRQYLDLKR